MKQKGIKSMIQHVSLGKKESKALKSKKPAIRRMARSAKGLTHMGD